MTVFSHSVAGALPGASDSIRPMIFGPRGWAIFGTVVVLLAGGIPLLNLILPVDSPLHVPDYLIPLLGKFACYALVALAMDLIWGYCGILSLGHGVFFALGGYIMGMHMSLSAAQAGLYRTAFPPFMEFMQRDSLPWFWAGFGHPAWALLMLLAGARSARLRFRLSGVSFAYQGGLLLHHHASPHLCRNAAVLPERDRPWR